MMASPANSSTESIRLEQVLREREDPFALIFRLSPDAVSLNRMKDGICLDISESFTKLSGYTREEMIGHSTLPGDLGIWVKAEDRQRMLHTLRARGEVIDFEAQFRSKGGRILTGLISARVLKIGAEDCLLTVTRDITQRKQMEEALERSERRYREIFNAANDGIMAHSQDGRILDVNEAMVRLFGYATKAEMLGRSIVELSRNIAPYSHAEARQWVRQTMHEGPQIFPWVARRKDGEEFWVEISLRCSEVNGEQRTLAVVRDISERKRAEFALKESETRYRTLFENMNEGVAYCQMLYEGGKTADFVYLAVNASFERQTGLKDVVGKRVSEVIPGVREMDPDLFSHYAEVAATGKPQRFEYYLSALEMWLDVSVYSPGPGHFVAVFDVITERKRVELERERLHGQLTQAQKLETVGRLAGGIAHDFNNMLQAILGNASLALEEIPPRSPARDNLEAIENCARRSAELTRQLLAFARQQPAQARVIDLNETLEGMLKMLQRLIGEAITLVWRPAHAPWPVRMDPSQVDQLLANLCVNARDAIDGIGAVTILTKNVSLDAPYCKTHPQFAPGDYVLLSVSDTGRGMDQKVREHIFEPFFTTKPVGQGTGLGLATVYGIVLQNGGGIEVSSEPGHGARFDIYLPRCGRGPSPSAETQSPAKARGAGETILLVEDEAAILLVTRLTLERLGYCVVSTTSPLEALQLAQQHPGAIDLLLSDVMMPEMNGRELANSLGRRFPRLRCVFMSGYTADIIATKGVVAEGIHFLPKPFTPSELAQALRTALEPSTSP
jgi:PAS domain S-box-containing protein